MTFARPSRGWAVTFFLASALAHADAPPLRTSGMATQSIAFVEVRGERVHVEQALLAFNFGREPVRAEELRVVLPHGASSFTSEPSRPGAPLLTLEGTTATAHGMLPPGESTLEFAWSVPYDDSGHVDLSLGLPPHAAGARAMTTANPGISLSVDGFSPAREQADGRGHRYLVAEKDVGDGILPGSTLTLHVRGLPAPSPLRFVPLAIAFVAMGATALASLARRRGTSAASPHAPPLEALEELAAREARALVAAHARGTLSPEAFEDAKARLVTRLARALTPR